MNTHDAPYHGPYVFQFGLGRFWAPAVGTAGPVVFACGRGGRTLAPRNVRLVRREHLSLREWTQ